MSALSRNLSRDGQCPSCIVFCGLQFSGKTTLAKRLAKLTRIPRLSLDDVRLELYGHLSTPRDWKTPKAKQAEDQKTKFAYDCLFLIIKKSLEARRPLIVEMSYLGPRENQLRRIARESKAKLRVIWCQIGADESREVKKRARKRPKDKDSAAIRESDYWMFKERIVKPKLRCRIVDTSKNISQCLREIVEYLNK